MNGASRHSGFFYFSLAIPRFIHCAALLLDLDMITLTRFSKFNSNRMLDINTRIFEDFAKMDNLLGGSRAGMLCVLLPCQVKGCDVTHVDVCLWTRSVELLTKLGSVYWLSLEDDCE